LIKVAKSLIPINLGNIRGGMKFKLKYKKEHLSYVDCIGWAKAKELGIKFLTGDEKFEDKDNVEFVK
jgi:predicted nucleic acid-binding protein